MSLVIQDMIPPIVSGVTKENHPFPRPTMSLRIESGLPLSSRYSRISFLLVPQLIELKSVYNDSAALDVSLLALSSKAPFPWLAVFQEVRRKEDKVDGMVVAQSVSVLLACIADAFFICTHTPITLQIQHLQTKVLTYGLRLVGELVLHFSYEMVHFRPLRYIYRKEGEPS